MGKKSIARKCLELSGLFEVELLVELMLRYWEHPLANDKGFRRSLLEAAVEVLRASDKGEVLFEDLPPKKVNFVSAIWYAECNSLDTVDQAEAAKREEWLEKVRRAIPSCFCNPEQLP
jgi:hypothetical protein